MSKTRTRILWKLAYRKVPIDQAIAILINDKQGGATHATVSTRREETQTIEKKRSA